MKKKHKTISILFILIIYILVSPDKERSDLRIIPAWSFNIQKYDSSGFENASLNPFRLGRYFGYIDYNGKASVVDKIYHNLAQSRKYFINYSSVTDNLVINKNDGTFYSNLKTSGYPFFIDERLFITSSNNKTISEWDTEGNMLFSFENEAEITSAAANAETFIAGFVDGTVIIADNERKIEKLMNPPLSRINSIYGLAVSSDSQQIAIITGLEPQYMLIMKKKNNQYNRIFTYQFADNLRYSRLISYSEDNRYLFFEGRSIFYCYDSKTKNLSSVRFEQSITNIHYIPETGFFAITVQDDNGSKSAFYLLYPDCRIIYTKSINKDVNFLGNHGNRFYFGAGTDIYSVDFIKEQHS